MKASLIPKDAYAMIIGAGKCGTSSLYSYLSGHPQISPCLLKEPEYFSEMQRHGVCSPHTLTKKDLGNGEYVPSYESLFEFDQRVHKYALEASTGYTKYPSELNVPKNISDYGIEPKFVYIIRNPFDRISSHFNFHQDTPNWNHDVTDPHLICCSNYYLQLSCYAKYFSFENFLLLDFDELKTEPASVVKKMLGFLGVSLDHEPISYEAKNITKMSSRLERLVRGLAPAGVAKVIPSELKGKLKGMAAKISTSSKKRELSDKETIYIKDMLGESMIQLEKIYDFDVSKWGFS